MYAIYFMLFYLFIHFYMYICLLFHTKFYNMKLLKVTSKNGKICIVNLDNVSLFYGINNNQTNICFLNETDIVEVEMSIDKITAMLGMFNDDNIIHELN